MRTPILGLALTALAACGGSPSRATGPDGAAVPIAWQAVAAKDSHVTVTLVVSGTPYVLGELDATADDVPPSPATCSVQKNTTPSEATFVCGGTPAYNGYRARIEGGQLIVTLETGVETGSGPMENPKSTEVKRLPIAGRSLAVAPFSPPTAAGAPVTGGY